MAWHEIMRYCRVAIMVACISLTHPHVPASTRRRAAERSMPSMSPAVEFAAVAASSKENQSAPTASRISGHMWMSDADASGNANNDDDDDVDDDDDDKDHDDDDDDACRPLAARKSTSAGEKSSRACACACAFADERGTPSDAASRSAATAMRVHASPSAAC